MTSRKHAGLAATSIVVLKIFALISVTVAGVYFYDVLMPPINMDEVAVLHKHIEKRWGYRGGTRFVKVIIARGTYLYEQDVSASFYDAVEVGDILRVELSRVLVRWKAAHLVHEGRVVTTQHGTDWLTDGLLGIFLLTPLSLFLPMRHRYPAQHRFLLVLVVISEALATLYGMRLVFWQSLR